MSEVHAVLPASRVLVATAETGAIEVTVVHTGATRATVRVQGEVDLANADLVADVLDNELTLGHRYVRLDLSRVSFLDCAGLTILVLAHNDFLAARGTLVLTGVGPRIARLLRITHLDEALFVADGPGEPSRARHLSSLAAGPAQ